MAITKETKNTRSRKYLLTINNPDEKEINDKSIVNAVEKIKTKYLAFCYETGSQGTYHVHIYFYFENAVNFNTMKKLFPTARIDTVQGSSQQVKSYLLKSAKEHKKQEDGSYEYKDSTGKLHSGTNHSETFKEFGECPTEVRGKRNDLEYIYNLIKEGYTNAEILELCPKTAIKHINHIERTRQAIREDEFKDEWRDIFCIYVFGETNTNKTRTYMEKYGYSNVYRITNYIGNGIWDGYRGQDTVIFEEYRSQILISEMLTWIEGYPNSSLRARYSDKVACFTNVIFISNISLEEQYPNVQKESPCKRQVLFHKFWQLFFHNYRHFIFHIFLSPTDFSVGFCLL